MTVETEVVNLDTMRANITAAEAALASHPEGDGMTLAASRAALLVTLKTARAAYIAARKALHVRLGLSDT